jgi:hypothetical protein
MSDQNTREFYIHPQYSKLQPEGNDESSNFAEELRIFLSRHQELSTSKQQLESLRYCYVHYINFDPASRDLPVQEKLNKAMEMAKKFSITENDEKR